MSTNLYYRPIIDEKIGLSFQLKKAISEKYWEHDGSLSGEWVCLNKEDIPYLKGIRDAGIKDADDLIEAIRKHDVIEIALIG